MDFAIPSPLRHTLARVRTFVDDELLPLEPQLLARGFESCERALEALRERVRGLGLWAPQLPRELGGMGLSVLEHGLVSEVLGRSPLGHYAFGCQAPDAGNAEILHRYGTAEQKRRFLEPLARGAIRSCFSMTEPEHPGSNPTLLSCRAVRQGDHYVIDGHKWFTSSADGAAFAIVMAITDPGAPPHLRASQIIVPTDTPGFRLVRNIPVMGHAGGGYASHAEIVYEACRVPADMLLGAEGQGFAIAQERLGPGRIHHCMRWLGICERAFDLLCERAATRALDAERNLGSSAIVQSWIAECRAEIDAARLLVLHAAWLIDQGGFHAAREQVSLIKFFAAGALGRVLDRAIQVHGALGVSGDTVLSYFYVHERGARIYDGPDEVHKVTVAKRILGRYGPEGRARAARGERAAGAGAASGHAASDGTVAVRAGEEVDLASLGAFLAERFGPRQPLAVEQFPGGHSNLTYLVRYGPLEVVLRRPPAGSTAKGAHDVLREHALLAALTPVYARAPRPLARCDDPAVLGAPFFLMERRPGLILRRDPPQGMRFDEAAAREISAGFVDALVDLHALDAGSPGLADLGRPQGYVERQVRGWTERYAAARTDDIPAVDRLAGWLAAHLPAVGPAPCVIHNDWKLDNLVVDPARPGRVEAVLDWEMATLGCPLMDLGTALAYWVEAGDPEQLQRLRFGPTSAPGMSTRRQLAEAYAERSGRALGDLVFYYAFGLFKTAVVAQQIYARFAKGLTRDPRFAALLGGVRVLAGQAEQAIARGSV